MGGSNYSRNYFMHNYVSADKIINKIKKEINDIYPQTKQNVIKIIKEAKIEKKFFYLKYEKNGFYGKKKAWWVYKGDIQIENISQYAINGVLCFPFEAKKELSLAEQRKFNSQFPDGYDNFINTIKECEIHNIPFVIMTGSNIFSVYK